MKNLDRDQLDGIYRILTYWRTKAGRTVIDACVSINYGTRGPYYDVIDGISDNDDLYIKMAIASCVPYTVIISQYLGYCNIQLNPDCSVRNKVITEYLDKHSTETETDYEIDDLNFELLKVKKPIL